ncbi:BMQ_0737 family morphogenetic spore coat protein [Falsibacillus albus]|uniref:DUF3794 domain-containing protein n=1 Tax=Falsibacillus albus TaxID=2478915 RepID=A0A3L7JQ76_9BACI|nr:hypothetical protein [Falsibacillus albus]RLQ92425.1 hypothetical protein D9X91_19470 [Falsibacillus albus]
MQAQPLRGAQELLCINAEKIYDWVILQSSESRRVTALELDLPASGFNPCSPEVSNLVTTCVLTDSSGTPVSLSSPNAVSIQEIGTRESRQFMVDGAVVTLQDVSWVKSFYIVLEFTGNNGVTPFLLRSAPILFEIPESAFLCAPDGTDLLVRLTEFKCRTRLNCFDAEVTSVDVYLTICQSVQTFADVTIELEAEFCQPRDIINEQCPAPIVPPQCPVIFPANGPAAR